MSNNSLAVLVVEDDEALRTLFLALLTRRGYRVDCVSDGGQALQRLARSTYSVVLLDLMMPVTSGFDVLARLEESDPSMLRKVIVTTGVSLRDLEKIDSSKVFAVLRKPFDINVLVSTIEACATPRMHREVSLDSSVKRFADALPQLDETFASPPACDRELMLRHELRQVVGELGGLLATMAKIEGDSGRADQYQKLGRRASVLAAARKIPLRHDH